MNTLQITKPNYTECTINDKIVESKIIIDNKLFHGDILNDDFSLKYSTRDKFLIGGVIRFHNKYTFGRNEKDVELFEFQPINWRYPKFLVPSNIKRNLLKAKESITDYFVVIKFKEWTNKIPIGTIELNLGSVKITNNQYNVLFHYYPTMPLVKPSPIEIIEPSPPFLSPTIHHEVYSIDPEGCKDIDDALSYDKKSNRIGIHIADTDALIESYTFNKYATIYAPHKNIPMFPENISNDLCSLLEEKPRNVITCWINNDDPVTFSFETNVIQVTKNLSYDQAEKLIHKNDNLKILYEKSIILGKELGIEVIDTHKMVEVYMVLYNREIAKHLESNPIMIYRNQTLFKKAIYDHIRIGHESLKLDYYTHASSPIRRYVDWIVQKLYKNKYVHIDELEKINNFEISVKRLYRMWDYLKASAIIKSGTSYEIELREIQEDRLVFFCEKLNIMIYNKIKYEVVDNENIVVNKQEYKIGSKYDRLLYLIEDKKNVLFFKILIQF